MTGSGVYPLDRPLSISGSYPRTQVITPPEREYRAKLWVYPDGGYELLAVRMPPVIEGRERLYATPDYGQYIVLPDEKAVIRLKRSNRCPALVLCDQIMTQAGNARRAAAKCRRLARNNAMRYMTTLTFPPSVPEDRQTRCRLFQRWVERHMGACLFRRQGYIMFPEPHKKGAFHLHILHRKRLNAATVRGFWTAFLVDMCGFPLPSGTRSVRTHQKDWGNAKEAAIYAAKYVSKMFTANYREHGKRRYYPSLGLVDGGHTFVSPSLPVVADICVLSPVKVWSSADDFLEWFYCAGDSKPPDLSAWAAWD